MPGNRRLILCVFIDAFGWEIIQHHHFLDDILTLKAPLATVFGYSSTCIPTILTGKMPRDHGHFSFFYYNPADSPFGVCRLLALLPRSVTRRGRVRRIMSRGIRRFYGYDGYFQIYNMPFRELPLFDYSEKRDLYKKGGINTGIGTIFDLLQERRIPHHVSNWRLKDADTVKELEAELEKGQVVFAYLYTAGLDAILHEYGKGSAPVSEKIAWYDVHLRRVLDLARRKYEEVRLFVFSDHGQANVVEEMPLMSRIGKLGLQFGRDYTAVYDSTVARFWFFNSGAREKIMHELEQVPRGKILSEQELAGLGCDFPEHKYGELFFLVEPGVLICPSFMGETPLAAMHGYHPDDKDSVAMFSSNVTPSRQPCRLDDLYGLMVDEASLAKPDQLP